ncbi:MAG TPA: hypothetical protein VFD95_07395 [Usitatibacter sp.]|jgi:hypothetical protein|nr:hypothetical protein [Usitatibacter sp.]
MRALTASLFAAALLLAGCADPIPQDRLAYTGEWEAPNVRLVITPDGHVNYLRQDGGTKVTINAPLKRFDGDNFVVGIGPFTTTFVVQKPPRAVEGRYVMTVDGRELVRVRAFGGAAGIIT